MCRFGHTRVDTSSDRAWFSLSVATPTAETIKVDRVGRIRGHYEWDDDSLIPGHKKGGGLHQNLFDADGNLKGNARFIPEDRTGFESAGYESTYVPSDQRREDDSDELGSLVSAVLIAAGVYAASAAAPVVLRWWRESARPQVVSASGQIRAKLSRRNSKGVPDASLTTDSTLVETTTLAQAGKPMSTAEAQARLLAALAAQAFADEQKRMISAAEIGDGMTLVELKQSLEALPQADLEALVLRMTTNPAMLGDDMLAQLASVLAQEETLRLDRPTTIE